MSAMGGTDDNSFHLKQIKPASTPALQEQDLDEEPNMVDSSESSSNLSPTMKKLPTCMFNNSQRTG